ncbi:MAK10-like protein [Tanacetum coccineum]
MEATLNDMLSNQFRNAKEYAYHLKQATNFMENQIVWESRQEDIRRPIPKPLIFYGPQRNPNEPPREQRGTSSIRHHPVGAKRMLVPWTSVQGSKPTPQGFLKTLDSLALDGENSERTRLRRTAKLRNDILMFQQHHGESLSEAWTRFKDLLQNVPHHGIDPWLQVQTFYDHALLEDLALYENESWNDPRDLAKLVKEITLPQDVPSTSDRRLIELENQICSGPHDTQYCTEDPEQAFVTYASSCTDKAGGLVSNFMASQDARLSKFEANFKQQQSEMTNKIDTVLKAITDRIAGTLPSDTSESHNDKPKEIEEEEKDNPENIHVNPSVLPDPSISFIIEKVLKHNSFFESLGLVPQSSNTELVCTKGEDDDVMFIEIVKTNDDSYKEEPEVGEQEVEYFDIFPTRSELAYHKYLMCGPIPSIFLRNPIITIKEGCSSNLKIPCNIGHVHMEKAYINLNSPLNIMTRMMYN